MTNKEAYVIPTIDDLRQKINESNQKAKKTMDKPSRYRYWKYREAVELYSTYDHPPIPIRQTMYKTAKGDLVSIYLELVVANVRLS